MMILNNKFDTCAMQLHTISGSYDYITGKIPSFD